MLYTYWMPLPLYNINYLIAFTLVPLSHGYFSIFTCCGLLFCLVSSCLTTLCPKKDDYRYPQPLFRFRTGTVKIQTVAELPLHLLLLPVLVWILSAVSCKREADVTWFHGQVKIVPSARYHMETDGSMFCLVMSCVTPDDAGEWRCLAVNPYGQSMCLAKIDILGSSFIH